MIYVMAEVDPDTGEQSRFVKIGYVGGRDFDSEAGRRSNELQCGNPRKIVPIGRVEGEIQDEQALHRRFERWRVVHPRGDDRVRRTEWFRVQVGSDIAAWVESVRVGGIEAWAPLMTGIPSNDGEAIVQPSRPVLLRCSICQSTSHGAARCDSPMVNETTSEQAAELEMAAKRLEQWKADEKRRLDALPPPERRKAGPASTWSWRGVERPAVSPGRLPKSLFR